MTDAELDNLVSELDSLEKKLSTLQKELEEDLSRVIATQEKWKSERLAAEQEADAKRKEVTFWEKLSDNWPTIFAAVIAGAAAGAAGMYYANDD